VSSAAPTEAMPPVARVRTRRRLRLGRHLEGYLAISPWLIGFVVFTVGPMVASLVLAFTKYDVLSSPQWIGLGNLQRLVGDRLVPTVAFNTGYFAVMSVVPRVLLALVLARLLAQNLAGIGLFRTAFYMPSVVPAVANVLLWVWIMQPQVGAANYVLRHIGLPGYAWLTHPDTSKISLAIMTLWYFGSQMLVFLAALQGVPTELYEAAKVDGAGPIRRFLNVTLPMITPAIFFNLVITVIDALQTFTSPLIATEGGPGYSTVMAVMYIYQQAFGSLRMGYASLLAWVAFVVVIILTAIQFRLSGWVYYEAQGAK
jgi:multiple sugar transport system permease protein